MIGRIRIAPPSRHRCRTPVFGIGWFVALLLLAALAELVVDPADIGGAGSDGAAGTR